MIKCANIGSLSCFSRDGKLKSRWRTDKEAINAAKFLNEKYQSNDTKLVAYKCNHCGYFHLTTKVKKK